MGFFFAIKLYIGVIVDQFSRMKAENEGTTTMTEGQLQWATTLKVVVRQCARRVAPPPKNALRLALYDIVTSAMFDGVIIGAIVLNVAIMAFDYWGIENDQVQYWRYTTGMLYLTRIYYAEAAVKIVGLGPTDYFSNWWCRFDFFLVIKQQSHSNI